VLARATELRIVLKIDARVATGDRCLGATFRGALTCAAPLRGRAGIAALSAIVAIRSQIGATPAAFRGRSSAASRLALARDANFMVSARGIASTAVRRVVGGVHTLAITEQRLRRSASGDSTLAVLARTLAAHGIASAAVVVIALQINALPLASNSIVATARFAVLVSLTRDEEAQEAAQQGGEASPNSALRRPQPG